MYISLSGSWLQRFSFHNSQLVMAARFAKQPACCGSTDKALGFPVLETNKLVVATQLDRQGLVRLHRCGFVASFLGSTVAALSAACGLHRSGFDRQSGKPDH